MNLAVGDLDQRSKFQTPVGVVIRIRDGNGKPLPELLNRDSISNMMVEADMDGALQTRQRPVGLPAVGGSPTKTSTNTIGRVASGDGDVDRHNKDMMLPILRRKFPTMYHAFSFFDLDNGNVVGPREVRNFVQRLRNEGEVLDRFREDEFLLELGIHTNSCTLDFHTFVKFFKFGDTLENWKEKLEVARQWRNKVLADQRAAAAFVYDNDKLSLCDQVKKSLKQKFKDVAEAFVFFDNQATSIISESAMKMGLRRIGLEHINVKALLKEVDENCVDGIIDEHEFRRYFAWHSLHGYDEMIFRALANRKEIASRSFRQSSAKHLSRSSSRRSSLSFGRTRSSASLLSDNARCGSANSLTLRRRSSSVLSSWSDTPRSTRAGSMALLRSPSSSGDRLEDLRKLLVKELRCRDEEILVVGVQDGDLVLAVLPDPRGVWPPHRLAEKLKELLKEPKNPLNKWDSSVRGAQQAVVLPQGVWNFNALQASALLDPSMTNGLISPGEKSLQPLNPTLRSMGFLKELGAQDHWVALDGLGKLQSNASKHVLDTAQVTILWHQKLDMAIELVHFSYGALNFTHGEDLAVHTCTEEGRERAGKDADFHALDTLYRIRNGEGLSLQERFARYDSPYVGRWVVYMDVPRVIIRNVCDEEYCLLLTPSGFIVLGAGKNPAALRVEGGAAPEAMSIADAKRFIRHQPTQEDDPSEIDGRHAAVVKDRREKLQKMKESAGEGETPAQLKEVIRRIENKELRVTLLTFFETAARQQESTERMLLQEGFRECCSAGKKLMAMVPLGSVLPIGERMNRRAHIIRLCGDFGKAWVSGTGCSTELAFFLDTVRTTVEHGKLNVALASFFRAGHEDPVHVVAYLAKQLNALVGRQDKAADMLPDVDLRDLADVSHKSLARVLHRVLIELVQQDKAVLLVLDNLSLAEQRILGLTMSMLRTDLHPWTYSLKRLGFVRIVFSGCDGYSAPSGVPMATIQLRRLSEKRAERLLAMLLHRTKKHIHPERLRVLLQKEGAGFVQYIRVAVEVLQDFWVFEQNNGYVEGLPSTLNGMYGTMIKAMERRHGAEDVERALAFLGEHNAMTAQELRKLQGLTDEDQQEKAAECSDEDRRDSRQRTLEEALRVLLRTPDAVDTFEIRDPELKAAILARYDGRQEAARHNEAESREREEARRERELMECPVYVEEVNKGIRTACKSLQEAVDAAAAGDVIVVRKEHTVLDKGLRVWRDLTIRAEGWTKDKRNAEADDSSADGVSIGRTPSGASQQTHKSEKGSTLKMLEIGYGQSMLEISNGEGERLKGAALPGDVVVVTLQGLGLKQVGFEAADIPNTIHVTDGAEVNMTGCTVSSDEGVGVRVQGGTVRMDDCACVSCAVQGVMIEAGGSAELEGCRLVANPASDVGEEERALHELFVRFCKGAVAEGGADKRFGGELKLSSMGSRATTLDLFEFTEVLTELGIYPAELTKTQVADLFARSNASGASDGVASEMDWLEFKDSMLLLLQALERKDVMGLTTEMLVATKKAKDAFSSSWKYSDGVTVMGAGSSATMRSCEFVNAINGCHILSRGSARLEQCTLAGCGRDRSDAAGVVACGKGAHAILKNCTVDRSSNYGLSVSKAGVIEAEGCKIINTGKQGVIAMGRGSRVDLRGTEVLGSGRSGIRAGQTALINAEACTVANSGESGIVAGFLGTRVNVESCSVQDNAVGIVAENEGLVVVGGSLEGIADACVCSRKGRLEKRRTDLEGGAGNNRSGKAEDHGAEDAQRQEEEATSQADEGEKEEEEEDEDEDEEVVMRFKQAVKRFKTGREAFEFFAQGTGAVARDNIVDGLMMLRAEAMEDSDDNVARTEEQEEEEGLLIEEQVAELWYLLELEDDDVLEEATFIEKLGRRKWRPKGQQRPQQAAVVHRRKSDANVEGLLENKIKNRRAKPETRKVMRAMAGWFDNVAEAFVMLDANAGGQVSLPEMERGLKRLGVFAELDFEELGREVGMQDGDELDIYRFVNYFIWHSKDKFPEGSWQEGYMEARRSRRRIVERFNQRFSDGSSPHKGTGGAAEPSVLQRDLQKRMLRKKNIWKKVQALETAGDNTKKKAQDRYLVHGGHVYKSSQDFRKGLAITRFPTTHGLPGTPTKFLKGSTPARYLNHLARDDAGV